MVASLPVKLHCCSTIHFIPMRHAVLLFALLLPLSAVAQPDTVRLCTWNVLDYGDAVPDERRQAFVEIINRLRPDVLVVQDLDNFAGYTSFRDGVMSILSSKQWVSGGFIDAEGSDNAMFYDPAKIDIISHDTLAHAGNAVDEWIVRRIGSDDTIHIFGAHLHPGNTEADKAQRGSEAWPIRMRAGDLPYEHHSWLTAGTLNAYANNDPGYVPITYIGGMQGEALDPLQTPGNWSDSAEFAWMHTSSTRVREFNGGAGGGLNDRFDFILISGNLMAHYVPDSYTAYGNDGGHFRDSVNRLPSEGYAPEVLNALHAASDHLPVYLDLVFDAPASDVPWEGNRVEKMDLSEVKK
jgi:hypothetical protein